MGTAIALAARGWGGTEETNVDAAARIELLSTNEWSFTSNTFYLQGLLQADRKHRSAARFCS